MRESIGGYLSRQRQLRGISLDELAESTRIPRRSLERLEGGAFDREPDGFARGFVRTVAEALGLEPDETVNRMRQEPDDPADGRPPRVRAKLVLGVSASALALLLSLWVVALCSAPDGLDGASGNTADLVMRRDAVRRLAEAVNALDEAEVPSEKISDRPPRPLDDASPPRRLPGHAEPRVQAPDLARGAIP